MLIFFAPMDSPLPLHGVHLLGLLWSTFLWNASFVSAQQHLKDGIFFLKLDGRKFIYLSRLASIR